MKNKKRLALTLCVAIMTSFSLVAQTASEKKTVMRDTCAFEMSATSTASIQDAPAQNDKRIALVQTPGEFTTKELKLKAGVYKFSITNKDINHPVGFVIMPVKKGKKKQAPAVEFGPIANGETKETPEVKLKKGKYEYFCPLNPTPRYSLVVTE